MTNAQRTAQLSETIKAHTERDTRDKASARAALIRKGFYLENGKPAPNFAPEEITA